MTAIDSTTKLINKASKIVIPKNLYEHLIKNIQTNYTPLSHREFGFLISYYGLNGEQKNLETIGNTQSKVLTRERVRQIINIVVNDLIIKTKESNSFNIFEFSYNKFLEILDGKTFIKLNTLIEDDFFNCFQNNHKGLIAFFNDIDIRQVAYRKNYYFYLEKTPRNEAIKEIQKENKSLRRDETLKKMAIKSKTVTYVPNQVRNFLLQQSTEKNINLNPLYENILKEFIKNKPFKANKFCFGKTKSWKARNGKAQWQQIGIYINKSIFDLIKKNVEHIKDDLNKTVSLMSFICQAFIWYYETTTKQHLALD